LNERYSLLYFQISQNEKKNIEEYLQISSSHIIDIDNTHFYKVPFSDIISLVKKRKVFLMHGKAFVPEEEMVYLFASYFKRALISGFEVRMKLLDL